MFRESRRLLRSRAFNVRTFGSGVAFLASLPNGLPECLIVDLQMPIMSGLALQQYLAGDGFHIPTIMITADDDAALAVDMVDDGLLDWPAGVVGSKDKAHAISISLFLGP